MDSTTLIPAAIVIFFAIGLHEYAHCKFADMAGDPTPGIYGRVTLDLTKHFELFGTLMMLLMATTGYGIGWGKPAPMDPSKMRNPRWDFFAAVAAGPISNLLQAIIWAFIARFMLISGQVTPSDIFGSEGMRAGNVVGLLLYFGVFLNLRLALFNLYPLGPLDGHWLLGLLLPEKPRLKWFLFNRRYGYMVLIGVVLLSQAAPQYSIFRPLDPVITKLGSLLFGIPLHERL